MTKIASFPSKRFKKSSLYENKNAVYFVQISLFVPEIFKFLKYANWPSDDVIHLTGLSCRIDPSKCNCCKSAGNCYQLRYREIKPKIRREISKLEK